MVFSSLSFLCVFLPIVLLASLLMPNMRAKNALLIVASLFFYAYGEPLYVVLMLVSAACNWGFGLAIGRAAPSATLASPGIPNTPAASDSSSVPASPGAPTSPAPSATLASPAVPASLSAPVNPASPGIPNTSAAPTRKLLFAVAVAFNLGFLAIFKYTSLIAQSLGLFLGVQLPFSDIALPIGISFYTFQALSYCIDVYRSERPDATEPSFAKVLLFISFFPQLIAGPIIRYHDVQQQLGQRRQGVEGIATGLRRFVVGLAKKVLIANPLGAVADSVYAAAPSEINIAVAWIGALSYLAQIYFDFSGYSDMAIGLARCFGFDYRENFNYPYISRSVREFWRRWHISLSTWFREYLYIPLGGNRRGRSRAVLNKLLVFALCGLWHGANWTFLAWGLFHGFFLLLEEYLPLCRLPRALGWLYTLLAVCTGFVLFRSADFSQALFMLQQMFSGWHFEPLEVSRTLRYLSALNILTFAVALIAATPVALRVKEMLIKTGDLRLRLSRSLSYAGAGVLAALSFLALSGGGYNPFIYFRF
jgi:alginate O-acetyltransferase complex protein AlgI